MAKMSKVEIERLLMVGTPGATSITQLNKNNQLQTWYAPALDDIFISIGALEKFDTPEEAKQRAIEIQRQAIANRQTA